jgi:hypothetical protein
MRIAAELTKLFGRDEATAITLAFWDKWLDATARAEVDPHRMLFAVGIIDAKPKHEREFLVTSGTAKEIIADFADFDQDRAITINITRIIKDIRRLAREIGTDLSAPFFLTPDHPHYGKIFGEAEQVRATALSRLRRDRKKFALNQRRATKIGVSKYRREHDLLKSIPPVCKIP